MQDPLSTLYLISVGVLWMGAYHAAMLARTSTLVRTCWIFAAICLVFSLFQLFTAMQYLAKDPRAAMAAHKWVNACAVLMIPLGWYLIASFVNTRRTLAIAHVAACVAALVLVYNGVDPLGYRFAALHPADPISLPWGETLYVLSGTPSWVSRLMRLLGFTLLLYACRVAFRTRKQQDRTANHLAVWSIAVMTASSILAALADMGVLKMPAISGFAFLFLLASFSIVLRADMSKTRSEKRRSDSALVQEVERHKLARQHVQHVLNNDWLTGLPNRAGALTGLHTLIDASRGKHATLTVFLIDLDRFGIINGTRGHQAGDQVLIELAQRLRKQVGETELIARLSGSGFLVALNNLAREEASVAALYEKLSDTVQAPFTIAGSLLRLTASAGVAMFPDDGESAEEVLAAAELARHDAKRFGPGHLTVYRPALREKIQEDIAFESALKDALEKDQFFLCYQPQVQASDGRIVCMEALIRWQHPSLGVVMPDRFIKLAESMGLIASIGAWVIESACAQLARWHAMGYAGLRVAVNLSAQQLLVSDLEQTVRAAIERHRLQGADIELEITESVLMQDPERSIERLGALRQLGVRLSIDDFGTGYSSLSYLRILPVHAFKLDRSFVRDLGNGEKDLEICASAIGLAKNLGLEVVAEGVETDAQAQQLRALGCHYLQGYLFARPLDVALAADFLASAFQTPQRMQENSEATGARLPQLQLFA
jgi:diguanylate cyclase (GGDEF)-like protein